MNIFLPRFVTIVLLGISLLQAQSGGTPKPTALDRGEPYAAEPSVVEHLDTTYRMHADGTGESFAHVVYRVQSEGAARALSVIVVTYMSETSNGTVENVRVHSRTAPSSIRLRQTALKCRHR